MANHGQLTPRQVRFVEEYLIDLNAAAAYRRAGYKARSDRIAAANAARLIANDSVAAAIREALAARSVRMRIDQDWVLDRLVRNHNRAAQVAPVLDKDGKRIGQYVYKAAAVNRALELIGKHLGMFRDKSDLAITGPPCKVYRTVEGFDPDTA